MGRRYYKPSRCRSPEHVWIRRPRTKDYTLKSGIFRARVIEAMGHKGAWYQVTALLSTGPFNAYGSMGSVDAAKQAAQRIIAQQHRLLGAKVLKA